LPTPGKNPAPAFLVTPLTVVCVIGWIWEKAGLSALSVHMKSVLEQGFSTKFAFDNKALKTFVEFRICWKRSKFCRFTQRSSCRLFLQICLTASFLIWTKPRPTRLKLEAHATPRHGYTRSMDNGMTCQCNSSSDPITRGAVSAEWLSGRVVASRWSWDAADRRAGLPSVPGPTWCAPVCCGTTDISCICTHQTHSHHGLSNDFHAPA